MNPRLQKVSKDIERTKAKIGELQSLLPGLERQKTELENAEVIKAFRSVGVAPGDFTAFIEAYRAGVVPAPARREQPTAATPFLNREEHHDDEE